MTAGTVRILFYLDSNDWHGHGSESLWAEPVENASQPAYQLLNSPFFFRGISFMDVVHATRQPDGILEFSGVASRSGRSTYMLLVSPFCPPFERYWKKLEALGCSYESRRIKTSYGPKIFYSVDVPENADIRGVYALLEEGEQKKIWMFQEGHVGHAAD